MMIRTKSIEGVKGQSDDISINGATRWAAAVLLLDDA